MLNRNKIDGHDNVMWKNVRAGDICQDTGPGWFGYVIRAFTLGSYAHSFVVIGKYPNGDLRTVEAMGTGVKYCRRKASKVYRAHRLWNDHEGQDRIVAEAKSHVGKRYAWGEIFAIFLNRLGIPFSYPDNPDTMICSNSSARAALKGDIPLEPYLTRSPDRIWPARLERDLNVAEWHYWYEWD